MSKEIELQQFCSREETRPYICQPFSLGEFTYATNGHIIVRVARRADAGEQDILKQGSVDKVLACHAGAEFKTFPTLSIPDAVREPCERCDGTGKEHADCDCCTHKCENCDGEGSCASRRSIAVGDVSFNVDYLLQLQKLPGFAFHRKPVVGIHPTPFIFDGGIGSIMPLRSNHAIHLGSLKGFIVKDEVAA